MVTRGQTVALMLGLVAIFAVALVTGIGDESPLALKESARGVLITGVLAVAGTLLGAALGLFGERYLRQQGRVGCDLIRRVETWRVSRTHLINTRPAGNDVSTENIRP
jgi:hypothetical protein